MSGLIDGVSKEGIERQLGVKLNDIQSEVFSNKTLSNISHLTTNFNEKLFCMDVTWRGFRGISHLCRGFSVTPPYQ